MAQIKGKTESGFEFDISDQVMNDMEVLEALSTIIEEENDFSAETIVAVSTLVKKILGKDKKRFYDHLRTEDGRVNPADVWTEMSQIISANKSGKN